MIGGRATDGADGTIAVTVGTGTGGTLLNDGTVLDFTVQADASGVVGLSFNELEVVPGDAASATFNALSLTAVPEPSSFLFLGITALGLIGWERARS